MKTTYKRYISTAIAALGLVSLGVCQVDQAQAALDTTNAPKITLNGTDINFSDAQPGVLNGELMVPVRDVAEQLGATVNWDNNIKECSITMPTDQQVVTLDANQDWLAMVTEDLEGRPLRFLGDNPSVSDSTLGDDQVVIIADRSYMPFDQLVTCLNGTGDWDKTSNTADITTTTPPPDSTLPSPDVTPDQSNTTAPDNTATPPDNSATPDNLMNRDNTASPDNSINPDDTTTPDNSNPPDNTANPDNGGVDKDYGNIDFGPVDQHTLWLLH